MHIQLAALDLDDTLLKHDLTISQANWNAIQRARESGIRIILASGRTFYSMKPYAEKLGIAGPGEYMISENGAEIIETATGRRIYERDIEGELCLEIAKAVRDNGFSYQFYEDGSIRSTAENWWTAEDTRLSGQKFKLVTIDEEKKLLEKGLVKFVIPGEPERIQVLFETMKKLLHGRAEAMISKPYFLEILPFGVNKGEALLHLTEFLGIDMEQVLAIGDSMNDAAMLNVAGIGCAPANANQAARDFADYICDYTHEEDAVAHIFSRFLVTG